MCVKPFISVHFESMQYMSVEMSSINRSTVIAIAQRFGHEGLCQLHTTLHTRQRPSWLKRCTVYCFLLCYVKCSTSLLTFKAVAMSLHHINAVHTHLPPLQDQNRSDVLLFHCYKDSQVGWCRGSSVKRSHYQCSQGLRGRRVLRQAQSLFCVIKGRKKSQPIRSVLKAVSQSVLRPFGNTVE